MFGFEWQDQRGIEGTGFVRALRSRLTAHLPILMPELQRIVETAIADELAAPGSDGKWGPPQLCLIPSDCSRIRALQIVLLGMSVTARLIVSQRRIPSSPRLRWNSRRGLS
jgi:hypothetical protein